MPDIVVMFFVLGLVAGLSRSDLSIPKAAYDTLSLLLMLTIGLKGGMALHGNLSWVLVPQLLGVVALGLLLPLILFPLLRHVVKLDLANAASLTAHYGSVSAGTFAVAVAFAETNALTMTGEVTLYLVLLELPAIIMAMMLYRRFAGAGALHQGHSLWREAFTNQSVILLIGGVVIGWMYGPQEGAMVTNLFTNAFMAVLALFLLEMGLVASMTLSRLSKDHLRLVAFALIAPPLLAIPGILMGHLLGLPEGSILILAALTASASYIAAPTAVRGTIPQADIGLAMLAALGVTFPFNVIVGIPLYHQLIQWL
ncbi:sodium-dependent bicarbonate transport family permease [Isoalcanivorax indicus]|uniref:sodium-dependent bicarbonate transport family permease n=1 Tax=Isoalcanivorax indicus TaxID=2202653 RepID=UPI000DB95928|nr:sodium-dependent bicarbonate transport family permease [Isoalcanivorax indicus]